jgi:hypothetical protein
MMVGHTKIYFRPDDGGTHKDNISDLMMVGHTKIYFRPDDGGTHKKIHFQLQ